MVWICLSVSLLMCGMALRFSLLEVETGGLDLPVCISNHVWNGSKISLLEMETGGLALPVCTSAHVRTGSHHTRISDMAGRERYSTLC